MQTPHMADSPCHDDRRKASTKAKPGQGDKGDRTVAKKK
jgi:hypothetical protein